MTENLLQYHYMALIQKQALRNYLDTVRPSGLDIAYCVVVTSFLLLAVMLPTLFNRYNTFGAGEVLRSGAGGVVGRFLLHIDQLSFTNNVVTFLLWGVVGMLVYGLVSSIVRAFAKAELNRELAGDEYVHPASFSRKKYWHEELLISAVSITSFAVVAVILASIALGLLPMATTHVRSAITSGGQDIWRAVASTVFLLVSVGIAMVSYKLWRHRKVLFEES